MKRHDLYLVRYVDNDAAKSHILKISDDNKLEGALCGFTPVGGWSKRGGSLKIYETTCTECNRLASDLGILKKAA